jgi:DHA3 family macrolide efflux protein-like MFS transporter
MFALLGQRNFFLLWIGHTVSIVGDYVFFIAITFWIYEQTGSALASGAVLITSSVPAILVAPLTGIVVDRWDRRRIMVAAESARALLFLGLLGSLAIQPHALWPIYLAGFVQSAVAAFFWQARSALLPRLIPPLSLLAANALYLVSDSGVRIVAPTLSAFALLHFGPSGVIILNVASFVVSAVCISLLPSSLRLRWDGGSSPGRNATSKRRDAPATSRVRDLLLLGALVTYTAGTLSILYPVFVRTALLAGPLAFGWLLTAQAIGEGIMSLFLARFLSQPGPVESMGFAVGGLTLAGLSLILIAFLHLLVPDLLFNTIYGAMIAATSVHLLTLLQQRVDNRFLGRALATYTGVQAFAQVFGMGMTTLLIGRIGVFWLLVFDGLLGVLGGVLATMRFLAAFGPDSTRRQ